MELKSLKDFIGIIAVNSSNRTFMELKLLSSRQDRRKVIVLIAPLWN